VSENVIRICDYDRRSREPDAVSPRNPVEAYVIFLEETPQWRRRQFVQAVANAVSLAYVAAMVMFSATFWPR
jgi:hypothetical protein